MLLINKIFGSSVGRKLAVGVTGLMLSGFILGHLIGNLQVFAGPDAVNSYAAKLQSLGPVLWVIRLVLLTAFISHVVLSIKLKMENSAARPVRYAQEKTIRATLASLTMPVSGLVILAFLVYHILHFTTGGFHSEYYHMKDYAGRHDVYSMIVMSFRDPLISLSYLTAVSMLSLHFRHAVQSVFQTFGWTGYGIRHYFDKVSLALSFAVFTGYASIPAAAYFNILKLTGES